MFLLSKSPVVLNSKKRIDRNQRTRLLLFPVVRRSDDLNKLENRINEDNEHERHRRECAEDSGLW